VAADKQKVIAAENALLISKLSLAQLLQLDDFRISTLPIPIMTPSKVK
jgi:hypothetical protein